MQDHASATIAVPAAAVAPWALSKTILDEAGLNAALHLLAPGAEKTLDAPAPGARVLFVAAGSVIVTSGLRNHILAAEDALRLPPGAALALRNREDYPAKVLVLALPPPPPARPPAIAFPSAE